MCDPVSVGIGIVGGAIASKVLAPKTSTASTVPTTDPAAERAAAEAEAQQSANRKLAEDQRRRRGQSSLLAQGAPSPTLGDTTSDPNSAQSPLGGPVFKGSKLTAALRSTLMSTGAVPAAAGAASPLGGSGSRSSQRATMQAY